MSNSRSNLMNGVGLLSTNDEQQSSAVKKTALRNVHYQNGSFLASHRGPVKIPRNKKLTPENPSSSPSNEHIVNARTRFELELGKGRGYSVEKYTHFLLPTQAFQPQQQNPNKQTRLKESHAMRAPVPSSTNLTLPGRLSSLPNHPVKNVLAADFLNVSAELPQKSVAKSTIEQRMSDRFTHLQQFLKQCDESPHRDYVATLLNLSPPDLSRHGIELEKRALHLKIEEGKELQRMNSLNTLTRSASEYPMQATQWSRK